VSQSRVAVTEARGNFGNPEKRLRLLLETVTRRLEVTRRRMKTNQADKTEVRALMSCEVYKTV
jgi:hypothetical protein